ncbi:hypothetical protein A9G13_01550 [Gilliamella sp. wkB178]|uniref:hypothetical protein n=1 Tax=Gilliamella sp. wkB178 TaxID=3120259 RepID=UPI00080E18C8|nr:hypothetical protein [Gilliamella apicola]OCG08773.1 hypothetical protein A9G13_01550 [Gilliamella apicola]
MPLLLLPYATTTQALSATTAQVIHGSAPYLTFDNGVTKVTTTDGLLGITISDGTTQTTYTPSHNTSTAANPIVLRVANQSFADIGMLVPPTTDSIALNALIGAPYNYWGDDDGDGQGTNGITASGNLTVSITDKDNQAVSRNEVLSICGAPYKVALTSTAGSLTTQYGLPNSSNFTGSTATYYISPKAPPKICYARPSLQYGKNNETIRGSSGWNLAGPATIWNPIKGFLVQSTESSGYSRNFPTTGANKLYFDLDIGGVKGSALTWPTVISQGGITATITPSPADANNIRVTLTGPHMNNRGTPSLPQTFVLVGKDSSNNEVLKYGFELKYWFVTRGGNYAKAPVQTTWCNSLGGGYRMSQVKDLTNAVCTSQAIAAGRNCEGAVGATPSSSTHYYQRNIGAGLFTEWGNMFYYNADFGYYPYAFWVSDSHGSERFVVGQESGDFAYNNPNYNGLAICVYP